jgi:hypothetical protein
MFGMKKSYGDRILDVHSHIWGVLEFPLHLLLYRSGWSRIEIGRFLYGICIVILASSFFVDWIVISNSALLVAFELVVTSALFVLSFSAQEFEERTGRVSPHILELFKIGTLTMLLFIIGTLSIFLLSGEIRWFSFISGILLGAAMSVPPTPKDHENWMRRFEYEDDL